MLTALTLLGGCTRPTLGATVTPEKPPLLLVEKLDARLAKEPCVGSLSHWSRHYRYNNRGNRLDKQLLWIDFVVAGYQGKSAGISIDPPRKWV